MTIQTKKEALVLALQLAITASTDEMSERCTAMADALASEMSEEEIEACKTIAMETIQ